MRFPSDGEFREAIRGQPVYERFHRKDRLLHILWELECAIRSKFNVHTPKPASLSIEHVMPQKWPDHWPLPNGQMVDGLDVLYEPTIFDQETQEAVRTSG